MITVIYQREAWVVYLVPRISWVRILGEERGAVIQLRKTQSLEFVKEKARPSDHTDYGPLIWCNESSDFRFHKSGRWANQTLQGRETQNYEAPGNWARGHCPQSYGKRGYKEGHPPIGWLETKVICRDDHGHQIWSRPDLRSGWAISQVQASRYLESSGVKTPKMRNPKISHRSLGSWLEVAWSDGEELC